MTRFFDRGTEKILVLVFESAFDLIDVSSEFGNTFVLDLIRSLCGDLILVRVVEVFFPVGLEDLFDGLATDLFLEVLSFLSHGFFID